MFGVPVFPIAQPAAAAPAIPVGAQTVEGISDFSPEALAQMLCKGGSFELPAQLPMLVPGILLPRLPGVKAPAMHVVASFIRSPKKVLSPAQEKQASSQMETMGGFITDADRRLSLLIVASIGRNFPQHEYFNRCLLHYATLWSGKKSGEDLVEILTSMAVILRAMLRKLQMTPAKLYEIVQTLQVENIDMIRFEDTYFIIYNMRVDRAFPVPAPWRWGTNADAVVAETNSVTKWYNGVLLREV